MDRNVKDLVCALKEQGLTLAMAESMTCGLAAHQLSTCRGTSEVLAGSIVCYTPEVKRRLFGISQKKIDMFTCESRQITEELARKLSKIIKADIYAALTGLASPGGSESRGKPVGTVFFSIRIKNRLYNEHKRFRGSPLEIKKKACKELYALIYRLTKKNYFN